MSVTGFNRLRREKAAKTPEPAPVATTQERPKRTRRRKPQPIEAHTTTQE